MARLIAFTRRMERRRQQGFAGLFKQGMGTAPAFAALRGNRANVPQAAGTIEHGLTDLALGRRETQTDIHDRLSRKHPCILSRYYALLETT